MKNTLMLMAFTLGTWSAASAAVVEIGQRYPSLVLKDGRQFQRVVVIGYDTATDRVTLQPEGQAPTEVSLIGLPDDVAAEVRKKIPLRSEDKIQADSPDGTAQRGPASLVNKNLRQQARADRETNQGAPRVDVDPAQPVVDRLGERKAAEGAAQKLGRQYFLTEAPPPAEAARVYEAEFNLDDAEPVSGFAHRWRVTGRVGIQYTHRRTGAIGRETKHFEMLVETPPDAAPTLVKVTIL